MIRRTALALVVMIPGLATAADNGVYLGAGLTHSDFGLDNPAGFSPFDDRDNGYKLFAGWRPLDSFGIGARYADHGDVTVPSGIVCIALIDAPCPDQTRINAKGASLFAVGYLNLPLVDLFAKVGLNHWQAEGFSFGTLAPTFRFDDSGSDLAWGIGAQARFGSLAARAEYERFKVLAGQDIGMVSLSLSWTFL